MAQHPGMTGATKPASFFWQGLGVLLPIAILAGVGVWTLRRDRSFAEQEARERAEALAEEGAGRLQAALAHQTASDEPSGHGTEESLEFLELDPYVVKVDSQGNLW